MNPRPAWADALKGGFAAMTKGPKPLVGYLKLMADAEVTGEDLVAFFETADKDDQALVHLRIALSRWDADEDEAAQWAAIGDEIPAPGSHERRARSVEILGFTPEQGDRILALAPISLTTSILIAKDFEPWYAEARQKRSTVYWEHYQDYLADSKHWPATSLQSLDATTTQVVERLSDPHRKEARQTKGLVVGYVQSGKTANFTGVVAKAIDAGYRLVIVLTGTIEVLRAQTQLRLDKELVGRENILDGLDENDPEVVKSLDYQQAEDWIKDLFVRHGDLEKQGAPAIRRLTTHHSDYKKLPHGQTQLRFQLQEPSRPLNDPANLNKSPVHVAIVKKNPAALKKLIADIKPFKHKASLPVLIIDDESDQASVDTTDPKKYAKDSPEGRKRTTINKLLSEFLTLLPRAQYIGYTATPFANVFIDPDDESDLFPSNFILSLERPPGYMGVADFHDIDRRYDDEERTVANSNELAFVRPLTADPEHSPDERIDELRQAIDAFVLTGAVKLFRQDVTGRRFGHHTMLVHESVKKVHHAEAAADVRELWAAGQFTAPEGRARLEPLWESDFAPVCAARSDGEPIPKSYDELAPYVAAAWAKLSAGGAPVAVMNSDKEVAAAQRSVDFESDDVWRILVGGTQLSRGFTIEGLTITYFRRQSAQADTLMQAGRWFGFRSGYRDLVRLYIRRDSGADLYKAFEALLLDEESFREELRQYAVLKDDGHPAVEPWQVPPLVSQHLPWLKPTARNKMWNARIDEKGSGGRTSDYYQLPDPQTEGRKHNLAAVAVPLLSLATEEVQLAYHLGEGGDAGYVPAKVGRVTKEELLAFLAPETGMHWHPEFEPIFGPTYRYLTRVSQAGTVTGWHLVWPQLLAESRETSPLFPGQSISLPGRKRRPGRTDFSGSDRKHRDVAERLAGTPRGLLPDPVREHLRNGSTSTGVILAYLARDTTEQTGKVPDPNSELVLLLSLVMPPDAVNDHSNRIRWVVQQKDKIGIAAVDKPKTAS
jgi:hypothetical protein